MLRAIIAILFQVNFELYMIVNFSRDDGKNMSLTQLAFSELIEHNTAMLKEDYSVRCSVKCFLLFVLALSLCSVGHSQTVKIGSQVWSTRNLDVSTFRNGDPIPEAEPRRSLPANYPSRLATRSSAKTPSPMPFSTVWFTPHTASNSRATPCARNGNFVIHSHA